MVHRVLCSGKSCTTGQRFRFGVAGIAETEKIVRTDVLQQKMEGVTVVVMLQMAELMQEYIVTQS